MKLGTQTASMTNHLYSRAVTGQPEPKVGMGATILMWTDRHAGTIIKVIEERGETIVAVQEDFATRTDKLGMTDSGQRYEYRPNPDGAITHFRRRKSGAWQKVCRNEKTGRWNQTEGSGLRVGERVEYHDFSF